MTRHSDISRREFLQGAGALAALAAAGGAVLTLPGCSDAVDSLTNAAGIEQPKRTVTDHAGREVEIPAVADVERIFATSALGQFFLLTLDWELLGGTNSTFTDEDYVYIPQEISKLPNLGSLAANSINEETLIFEDIKLIFSISAVALTEANISDAETLQSQTGIPVLLVDGSMDKIAAAYEFLGEILGVEERAQELSDYCTGSYDRVLAAIGGLSEDEKKTLYYAEGDDGLNSEPRNNQHSVAFEMAGAINVCGGEDDLGTGMIPVSLENVISWDPQYIIVRDSTEEQMLMQNILTDSSWSVIDAVKNGRVYLMPMVPFSWIDRPPSAARFLGIQWIANMLYPDLYDVDMVSETKEFYRLFYGTEPTDEAVLEFLGDSYPPGG